MIILRLVIASLLVTNSIHGQGDRSGYSLTYAISRSSVTNKAGGNWEDALSSSIFAHYEFGKRNTLSYSIGLGYLQSHIIFRDHSGMQAYRDEERHYRINYIMVPAGMKFFIGSFYLHPEVGMSYNYSFTTKSYLVDLEKNIINKNYSNDRISRRFEPELCNALAVGYEFKMKSIILLTAIKGYLAFNPGFINTYGIGLMVGLKL